MRERSPDARCPAGPSVRGRHRARPRDLRTGRRSRSRRHPAVGSGRRRSRHQAWDVRIVPPWPAVDLRAHGGARRERRRWLRRLLSCSGPQRYSIDDHVPPTLAALVEPLAAVLNGVERARPRLGECAAIFGAGAIGGMFLKALQASGIDRIWMVDPVASRREPAERLGASGATSSLEELIDAIRSGLAPAPDLVVDAVGTCLGDAIRVVADGGRVLLFGINEAAELPIRQFEITSRELSIIGALTSRFTSGRHCDDRERHIHARRHPSARDTRRSARRSARPPSPRDGVQGHGETRARPGPLITDREVR